MDVVRWTVAGFILLNAFFGTVRAIRVAAWKFDGVPRRRGAEILTRLSWPLILLWLASMVLFLASAVLLVRERPAAAAVFIVALGLDLGIFWLAQGSSRVGPSAMQERLTGYVLFGLLFLGGLRAERMRGHAGPVAYESRSETPDRGAAA